MNALLRLCLCLSHVAAVTVPTNLSVSSSTFVDPENVTEDDLHFTAHLRRHAALHGTSAILAPYRKVSSTCSSRLVPLSHCRQWSGVALVSRAPYLSL